MEKKCLNKDLMIMNLISKQMTSYAATQWLKSPNKNFNDKSPSEMMKDGKSNMVYRELKKTFNKDE